ncbi:MAG: hypothetical protein V7707_15620 [Motiliproteus sp.]
MQGPWYTLEDAEELLSFRRAELLHHIDTGDLRPVVTTKQRSLLVFRRDKNRRWIGLGTCSYRGCLALHPDSIINLIENGEIKLGKGSARLLESHRVQDWSSHYPFKQLPPFDVLEEWRGCEMEAVELRKLAVTPLPLEGQSSTAFIGDLTKSAMLFMAKDEQAVTESKEMAQIDEVVKLYPYAWSFDANSKFSSEDLRIAASEIERFKSASTAESTLDSIEADPTKKDPAPLVEGKRANQLHQLFIRAIVDNPDSKTRILWKLIQQDWESDEPQYDLDNIITNMDGSGIEWRSNHYNERSFMSSSFGPVLSKLKKQM